MRLLLYSEVTGESVFSAEWSAKSVYYSRQEWASKIKRAIGWWMDVDNGWWWMTKRERWMNHLVLWNWRCTHKSCLGFWVLHLQCSCSSQSQIKVVSLISKAFCNHWRESVTCCNEPPHILYVIFVKGFFQIQTVIIKQLKENTIVMPSLIKKSYQRNLWNYKSELSMKAI